MIWFVIGISVGTLVGAGVIFLFASGKVCDLRGKCPLCQALEENQKLNHRLKNLEFDLLVSETELLMDFDETGERKIFSCVGQA
ncbi:MAG: hypothetical protein ABSF48_25210 [Thermodesulfobacteriota bacterium]|jgi:hypothetical protein